MTTDIFNLGRDQTDALFSDQRLEPKDLKFMDRFITNNMRMLEKEKKNGSTHFSRVREKQFVDRLEQAMKVLLRHKLERRNGNRI